MKVADFFPKDTYQARDRVVRPFTAQYKYCTLVKASFHADMNAWM